MTYTKTTVIEDAEFEPRTAYEDSCFGNELDSIGLLDMMPDEAGNKKTFSRGRFEITVKFTPKEEK